jgi:hypothetical protein
MAARADTLHAGTPCAAREAPSRAPDGVFFPPFFFPTPPRTADGGPSPFLGGVIIIIFFFGVLVLFAPSRPFLLASLAVLVADRALLMPFKTSFCSFVLLALLLY